MGRVSRFLLLAEDPGPPPGDRAAAGVQGFRGGDLGEVGGGADGVLEVVVAEVAHALIELSAAGGVHGGDAFGLAGGALLGHAGALMRGAGVLAGALGPCGLLVVTEQGATVLGHRAGVRGPRGTGLEGGGAGQVVPVPVVGRGELVSGLEVLGEGAEPGPALEAGDRGAVVVSLRPLAAQLGVIVAEVGADLVEVVEPRVPPPADGGGPVGVALLVGRQGVGRVAKDLGGFPEGDGGHLPRRRRTVGREMPDTRTASDSLMPSWMAAMIAPWSS